MEAINSVIDTIKERATNPFFATLIGVWIFRNWLLVYTLFNFDEGTKLVAKQKFIEEYFLKQNFFEELSINIGISLSFVMLAFILLVFTRIIINVANHRLTPYFNSKTVSKLVVNNNRFQTVKKQRDDFFTTLEDAQETIINLEQRNSLLRTENTELESIKDQNARLKFDVENLENTRKVIQEDLKKSGNEISSKLNEISQLKYSLQKLNWEKNLIEDIFLSDFLEFESLPESKQQKILNEIPEQLIKPFDALNADKFLSQTLDIIKEAIENPFREEDFTIDFTQAKKLESLGLISKYNNNQDYEIDNLEVSPLATLIQRLEKPLQKRWNKLNLPF